MTTTTHNPDTTDRWTLITHYWTHEYTWLWLLPGLFFGVIIGFVAGWLAVNSITGQEVRELINDFVPEAIGIGLTVSVLYFYEQRRDEKREEKRLKDELLWQIHSRANELAISAIDRLQAKGWLHLLKKQNLDAVQWIGAGLQYIDLSGVTMIATNLSGAQMWHTNLSGSMMWFTNLSGANMWLANLSGAAMMSANLNGADMSNANLENADLENAIFDENTVLPDKTKWTPATDMKRFTDPTHPDFWRSDEPTSPAYRGRAAQSGG